VAGGHTTQAQHSHSPYASYQTREIKALSTDEVEGYLSGAGLGMSLPAELNGYPGPRHVLELADGLGLSQEQSAEVRRIFDSMESQAIEIGAQVVESERQLDTEFAERTISPTRVTLLTDKIARLQGQLRAVHLLAHLGVAAALTPEQRKTYDRLRGY
jgi:Spy/CpxP family protein refolding chaperone